MTDCPDRTAADFTLADRRIAVREAPHHVREAVHALLVGQMAGDLILHRADLSNTVDCRDVLVEAGYGTDSINNLLTRAIQAARSA
ncbi:hypothetical protein PE067_10485 [Paracoccus sp. DMF-8]|uniref:hypothetical protein n=1 Tax=Paracoccus sp. DMF-8 TaxID=3019445 RepID=UPI0023E80B0B|nr:hypothetical protein [Paracoccus sp. DMF-8]MDF3606527.1 hypothetical protein [Paracoccus sp. DMF-8]